MNYSFSIKFQDEPGIDAGGLKREFYDMIGNTLKDDTYKFFGPVQNNMSKYFLHPHFNKVKEKQKYALLFGKVIITSTLAHRERHSERLHYRHRYNLPILEGSVRRANLLRGLEGYPG